MITAKGYNRIWDPKTKTKQMEHRIIWEQHYGPIPAGHQIHHINHNKLDNRIENLQLVTPTEHKRLHGPYKKRHGIWYKQCSTCQKYKAVTHNNWHLTNQQPHRNNCIPCHNNKRRNQ